VHMLQCIQVGSRSDKLKDIGLGAVAVGRFFLDLTTRHPRSTAFWVGPIPSLTGEKKTRSGGLAIDSLVRAMNVLRSR
jgi:hypothetical protein